jgi:hypothetical protein
MTRLLTALLTLSLLGACAANQKRDLKQTKLDVDKTRDNELRAPRGPRYPVRPGMEALQRAALGCYNQGLKHNPIFAKGGTIVIRWAADRSGDLLRMDFVEDSFRGWGINAKEESLADCITNAARAAKVLWSSEGTAPMRFKPDEQAGAPDSTPASAPAPSPAPTQAPTSGT